MVKKVSIEIQSLQQYWICGIQFFDEDGLYIDPGGAIDNKKVQYYESEKMTITSDSQIY